MEDFSDAENSQLREENGGCRTGEASGDHCERALGTIPLTLMGHSSPNCQ